MRIKKKRLISGDGRWMVQAPPGYKGRTYIGGRYVYEYRLLMEKKIGRLLMAGDIIARRAQCASFLRART